MLSDLQLTTYLQYASYIHCILCAGMAIVHERTIPTKQPPLLAKLVPTFVHRGCRVVSTADLHSRILGFLDQSLYNFFQVAPQLYSRGWMGPIPDPQLLRNLVAQRIEPENRTRASGSVGKNSDHCVLYNLYILTVLIYLSKIYKSFPNSTLPALFQEVWLVV
jgi:hypothetical protein